MVITPRILLNAYCQGIFPMADADDEQIYWYDPDPRAVLPLDDKFHVSRRLQRTIRRGNFDIRVDTQFRQVMRLCAEPSPERERTWISDEIIQLYYSLHKSGYAHSVETWQDGELVGGLYGVSVGGLFAGESMFSRVTDGSKVALVYLVEHLRAKGFVLLDIQFMTSHLKRFGAMNIPRLKYHQRLADALTKDITF
ncbi:leucyl/phenylalanyl-tRNA--protein transferase [Anaerolineales bacterium HSG6]|nr:leucyl/phenylalanyl-tRNA--protein transferase [Anaerolineales bacterium HSG6]MDM8529592.1 leucyl/phenylalanyl-tRNA--protein transferase [Anaerolineales bacterium HSG25]